MSDAPDTLRDAPVDRPPKPARRARALPLLGLLLVLGVLVFGRVLLSSNTEYQRGRAYLGAGDEVSARMAFRRAASWGAPGNPYAHRSLDALASLARDAEGEGRIDDALASWRAVRGAVLGARTFGRPRSERLAVADRRIAALMARQEVTGAHLTAAQEDEEELRAHFLAELEAPIAPAPGWTASLLAGFLVFLSGAFLLSREGFDVQGRLRRGLVWRYLAVTLVGFLLFVVGLANA